MREQQDLAYVLRTHELGEADLIVTLFAERHGRVRAVATQARRSRRRFGGALEPLTQVQAAWSDRPGRELQRLERMDCVRSFAALQSEPLCQAACAVLVELCGAFTHEGQADPQGFRLMGAVLAALDAGQGDPLVLVRYYEYWTLRLHGLLPELGACTRCSRPLAQDLAAWVAAGAAGLSCAACASAVGRRRIGAAERAFLEAAARSAPGQMPGIRQPARAGGALELLLRGALESYAERSFRSYRHLRLQAAVAP
jgi:DNA repair protein RecO (recombination protein O)